MNIILHYFSTYEKIFGSGRYDSALCKALKNEVSEHISDRVKICVHGNSEGAVDIRQWLPLFEDLPKHRPLHADCIIIQIKPSDRFWVLDFQDPMHAIKATARHPKFAGGTATMYSQKWLEENVEKYWRVNAGYYFPMYPNSVQSAYHELKDITPTDDRLFFAGTIGDEDVEYQYTNTNGQPRRMVARHLQNKYPDRVRILDRTQKFDRDEWYRQAVNHKLCLALEGHPHCNREHELYGLGVPVLMSEMKNPDGLGLLPNHHYIAAEGGQRYYYGAPKDQEQFADMLFKTFENVINDDELLNSISKNARELFERRLLPKPAARRYMELINWDRLI